MNNPQRNKPLSRRDFLKLGGGMLGLLGAGGLARKALLQPVEVVQAARSPLPLGRVEQGVLQQTVDDFDLHLIASDGWIHLPPDKVVPPYHPDDYAPAGLTTYIFGYRNVNGFTEDMVHSQKMKVQLTAPVFSIAQEHDFKLKLTNLGLQMRPDLVDAHTVHFHGFRNAIPIFDGEPHSSVGVPIIRDLTYFYRPHHPGTYMYHCHFEETEHVHMGMVGICYVIPKLSEELPGRKFAYNDYDTEYDREFVLTLNEVWALAHWCDSHIQLPEWSDYKADFHLINGRAYPHTLLPNAGTDAIHGLNNDPVTGDLIFPDHPELRYQPVSSLITCEPGERVLLRIANLGFSQQFLKTTGVRMRVVGKDATPLIKRRPVAGQTVGDLIADISYYTDTVDIAPGESRDVIFVAPNTPGEYMLYNRNLRHQSNGGHAGRGGMMTKIVVFPSGTLTAQNQPNEWCTPSGWMPAL
jgi:FtsP/CotA-like multicopper oxidase with cupredoxin domain